MGGLIETVLGGLLGGILALLGVWLAGWQERKRAREAKMPKISSPCGVVVPMFS